jgi:plastocyanin
MLSRTLLLSAAFSLASAANFDIQVGENGNSYTPATIAAQQGDTVTFHFTGSVHDVVQSTFDAPCTPKSGGIYAPIQSKAGETFTVTVQNTDPIWFYCSVPGHCNSGMVGVINAP